jgi:hypothetical protein
VLCLSIPNLKLYSSQVLKREAPDLDKTVSAYRSSWSYRHSTTLCIVISGE